MAQEAEDNLVLVGRITVPHGIRGEVKMRPLMEQPEILASLPAVQLRLPDAPDREARVRSVRMHLGAAMLTVEGVTDRTGAEALHGAEVYVRRDQLPELEPDVYYEADLLGLAVVTESGRDLGRITKVLFLPANDVYETDVALIPAVADEIVLSVDLEAGRMVVRDIPGLRKDE